MIDKKKLLAAVTLFLAALGISYTLIPSNETPPSPPSASSTPAQVPDVPLLTPADFSYQGLAKVPRTLGQNRKRLPLGAAELPPGSVGQALRHVRYSRQHSAKSIVGLRADRRFGSNLNTRPGVVEAKKLIHWPLLSQKPFGHPGSPLYSHS